MGRPGDQKSMRARLAKAGVVGMPCARCGQPILAGQRWDLDHVDVIYADGGEGRRLPSHEYCNRSHGGRVGNERRGKRWEKPVKTEIATWGAAAIQIDQARRHTWVATATHDKQERVVVKLWPPLRGTDVAKKVSRWCEDLGVMVTAINPRSPSATLLEPLSRELRLELADGVGMATAQGRFADLLNAGRLLIVGRPELTEAARLAEVRKTAGSYALDGYAGLEPLVACQLAVWALEGNSVRPFILS